jgi:hypothetical protein
MEVAVTPVRAVAAAMLWFALSPAPALALNWEGHQDWFLDPVLIERFSSELPPPLAKPTPTCADMEARYRSNTYEQIPLPGVNCREDRQGGQ